MPPSPRTDTLASFSSKGPGLFPAHRLKPDIVAPGDNVRSSINTNDNAYGGNLSGTLDGGAAYRRLRGAVPLGEPGCDLWQCL